MNLFVYYRISDKGRPKEKLPNGDKFSCLKNAIYEFGAENFHVIADNCKPETVDFIRSFSAKGLTFEETSLGNSASFMYMLNKIIKKHNPDDFVYLLEDDYLHLPYSKKVLLEGLQIADYVTLYDHPDNYKLFGYGGTQFNNKKLKKTRIYLTHSSHWRETVSTTMSFACNVQTLIKDYKTWKHYTKTVIPHDFFAFIRITCQRNPRDMLFMLLKGKKIFLIMLGNFFRKKKLLINSIPAYSTHTETLYLSPIVNINEAVI